jgi:hypothetical protein
MTSKPRNFAITSSMKKQFILAPSLLLLAGALSFVGARPANAAPCSINDTLATRLGVSCTTAQGFEFTLTNFSGFTPTDDLAITPAGLNNFQYTVQGSSYIPGPSYILNYTLIAPANRFLDMFTAGGSTSIPGTTSTFNVAAISPQAQLAAGNINFTGAVNGVDNFAGNIKTSTFTATLNVTAGQVASVTSFVSSKQPPPVPGPVPLLGAGCAFGLSRKLRRRIKLAA